MLFLSFVISLISEYHKSEVPSDGCALLDKRDLEGYPGSLYNIYNLSKLLD